MLGVVLTLGPTEGQRHQKVLLAEWLPLLLLSSLARPLYQESEMKQQRMLWSPSEPIPHLTLTASSFV